MKKTLLVLTLLLIGSTSVYAACPNSGGTYTSKHQEYLCKRFVTIVYQGATHQIDFAKVQTVVQDSHGHMQFFLNPKPPWTGSSAHYYVVFDNGTYLMLPSSTSEPKPADAWNAYRDFLIENPSFIGMR